MSSPSDNSERKAAEKMFAFADAYVEGLAQQIAMLQEQLDAAIAMRKGLREKFPSYWVVGDQSGLTEVPKPMNEISVDPAVLAVRNLPRRESNEEKVLRHAKEVLEVALVPLDRHDLFLSFRELGFTPAVNDPMKFIGRTLWKSPAFIHDKREGHWSGYWLRDRELPRVD